eukprot:7379623-Prymnesium_polylepis.1
MLFLAVLIVLTPMTACCCSPELNPSHWRPRSLPQYLHDCQPAVYEELMRAHPGSWGAAPRQPVQRCVATKGATRS